MFRSPLPLNSWLCSRMTRRPSGSGFVYPNEAGSEEASGREVGAGTGGCNELLDPRGRPHCGGGHRAVVGRRTRARRHRRERQPGPRRPDRLGCIGEVQRHRRRAAGGRLRRPRRWRSGQRRDRLHAGQRHHGALLGHRDLPHLGQRRGPERHHHQDHQHTRIADRRDRQRHARGRCKQRLPGRRLRRRRPARHRRRLRGLRHRAVSAQPQPAGDRLRPAAGLQDRHGKGRVGRFRRPHRGHPGATSSPTPNSPQATTSCCCP
jgi:hypothetical protein